MLEYFWSGERKRCDEIWDRETSMRGRSFVEIVDEQGTFERMWQKTSARFHGPQYVKRQYVSTHRRNMETHQRLRKHLFYKFDGSVGLPSWDMYLSMVLGMLYKAELRSWIAYLVEQVGDVRLIPHWMKLQWVAAIYQGGESEVCGICSGRPDPSLVTGPDYLCSQK